MPRLLPNENRNWSFETANLEGVMTWACRFYASPLMSGSEYNLCISFSLLMSSLVAFVSESVVESVKGAYRLRKAYQILHKMFDMIVRVEAVAKLENTPLTDDSQEESAGRTRGWGLSEYGAAGIMDASKNVDGLVDLSQDHLNRMSLDVQSAHFVSECPASSSTNPAKSSSPDSVERQSVSSTLSFHMIPSCPPLRATFTDKTVYSGTLMALGTIMLLISLLPQSLSRLLSIIGFRGSRSQALSMLWQISTIPTPFGAIATFALGTYYGTILQNCDIVSDNFKGQRHDSAATLERLHHILLLARKRYPRSALWVVEEARMDSMRGNLEGVLRRLTDLKVNTRLPQIESLVVFEGALYEN